jgi:predicted ABC-type ATPase|nr:hypothetical protein [Christensenella tenuis]
MLAQNRGFTFETVLSTDRNLKLLEKAKKRGYFIRVFYIITHDPQINVTRVQTRVADGGHDVPRGKIISRYYRAVELVPALVNICDICHIYDNSDEPFRIFKKRKDQYFYWENKYWKKPRIEELTGISLK